MAFITYKYSPRSPVALIGNDFNRVLSCGNSHTNLIHNKSWTTEFSPGRFNFPSLVPALQTSKEQVFTHPNLKEYIWQVKRRKHCFSHNVHQKRKFRHLIMSDNNSNDCHCAPLVVLPCHRVPGLPSDR